MSGRRGRLRVVEPASRDGPVRRPFPWWGTVLVAAPWAWFFVRDADGPVDLLAVSMPAVGIVAALAALVLIPTRRRLGAAVAVSVLTVCIVATGLPRIPQGTDPPTHSIRIAAANVVYGNPAAEGAAEVMSSRDADVIVSVEVRKEYWKDLSAHADAYPFGIVDGELGVRARWPLKQMSTPAGLAAGRVIRVSVDTPEGLFVVYAVHALNPLHETSFAQQRVFLERLLDAAAAEPVPAMIVGDLNLSDRLAGYRTMDGAMRDAMRSGGWAPSTYLHGGWRLLLLRIDHIFVPEDWCAADPSTFEVPGSDHDGVEATVGPCGSSFTA